MQVCFIGHRKITQTDALISLLRETVVQLIKQGANTFLFGSMSQFDDLSWKIVTELKRTYPHIKRVYVRAAFKNIDKTYEDYLLNSYEETYYPKTLSRAGKFSYVERNYEMIEKSTHCIFYFDKNYTPTTQSNEKIISVPMRNSGTKIAYEYAVRRHKIIYNLFDILAQF